MIIADPQTGMDAVVRARLVALRPALHRYAARMVGSAFEGEDVLQEALARAIAAIDRAPPAGDADAWLFRITHNAAIDFLRSRKRLSVQRPVEDDDMVSDADEAARRLAASSALSVFMRLPSAQRATVILKDVLGYSNEETSTILDMTIAATKAALHRGRAKLRLFASESAPAPQFDHHDLGRLQAYVDRFNARDFEAIRDLLADDVRFDLVARMQGGKAAFETYFSRYGEMNAWRFSTGLVDGHLAILVTDLGEPSDTPINLIAIEWKGGKITRLRDFFHAPYVLDSAATSLLDLSKSS